MKDSDTQDDIQESDVDSWPWECLNCQTTIFHDSLYCRDCEAWKWAETASGQSGPVGSFVDWMQRESYPSFVTKVTVIAGIELGLTAVWIHLLILGSVWEISFVPIG